MYDLRQHMELFGSLFIMTFVLEDLALVSALTLIVQGKTSLAVAFSACFLGIVIGDIFLYLIGRLAYLHPFLQNRSVVQSAIKLTTSTWDSALFISRMIPGTRLPTYIGAGVAQYSFLRFLVLTLVSVSLWVGIALWSGLQLGIIFSDHLVLVVILFLVIILMMRFLALNLFDPWKRKFFVHRWRKWVSFEFWPAWLFYLPIIPYYVYNSVRTKSLFNPFYANPEILNGGLVGESKWDFLKHIPNGEESYLPSALIAKGSTAQDIESKMRELNISYPVILKPDVGQRGFAVRVIKNSEELMAYLQNVDFDLILQKKSRYKKEAGLFYIRRPSQESGFIFSITDKVFPFVIGDGKTSVGHLILKNKRARIIAPTYFSRHQSQLDTVLKENEVFLLTECGNHCQGAIFLNGKDLKTAALEEAIDSICKKIPHFYFGRLDIRYESAEGLKAGKNFEIIEVNGAGSEATHIWDQSTTLTEAYGSLFQQWDYLFEVGQEVKKNYPAKTNTSIFRFFYDFLRLIFRKHKLTVSS